MTSAAAQRAALEDAYLPYSTRSLVASKPPTYLPISPQARQRLTIRSSRFIFDDPPLIPLLRRSHDHSSDIPPRRYIVPKLKTSTFRWRKTDRPSPRHTFGLMDELTSVRKSPSPPLIPPKKSTRKPIGGRNSVKIPKLPPVQSPGLPSNVPPGLQPVLPPIYIPGVKTCVDGKAAGWRYEGTGGETPGAWTPELTDS